MLRRSLLGLAMRVAIAVCFALSVAASSAQTISPASPPEAASPPASPQTVSPQPAASSEPSASYPKRLTLWHLVHDLCVPGSRRGDPKPCTDVTLPDGREAQGYVVLKDRRGVAQYLVMPTILISGIEDARLLSPATPDYFAPAWRAKALVEERLGAKLAREDVAIAVNSSYGRTQDLLHLHVDCLRADIRDRLRQSQPGYRWHKITLSGHRYYARRLGEDSKVSPFRLLAQGLHVKPEDMGAWTLVLTGAAFADNKPDFILLAGKANPLLANFASGEELQDHDCKRNG